MMRSKREPDDLLDGTSYRELRLLSEVEVTSQASQRDLAKRVGIALGLTNVLLRNLAEKGYVRVTRSGWKRWLYALTPSGFSRKIHLTVAYIQRVLDHYHRVRQTLREELEPLALNEESRVAIYGTGEFAELVYLGLREVGIEEIDVFADAGRAGGKFLGILVRDPATLRPQDYDRVVVASLNHGGSEEADLLEQGVDADKLVTFFADGKVREEG